MPSFQEQRETDERWFRFPAREYLDRADGRFALTFDDGPDPDATPAVLDALDAVDAKGTFFLVGEQAEAHPALAREVAERGHAVGLHSHRHDEQASLADPAADLEQCRAALLAAGALADDAPLLFRPPYGRFSAASYEACLAAGCAPVYWSAWGYDWEPLPAERIADLVVRDLAPGRIVLLHDSPRYARRPSAQPTADALPAILAAARERGLASVAVEP